MTKWNLANDVEGECNAHMYIADDYGDGTGTFRCQLPEGHEGSHREDFKRGVLTWEKDERDYNIYQDCELCKGYGWLTVDLDDVDCYKCEGFCRIVIGNIKE